MVGGCQEEEGGEKQVKIKTHLVSTIRTSLMLMFVPFMLPAI